MKRAREEKGLELNMTPMIDVVFNLLVFLMVVSDLTRKEFDELELPFSAVAIEDPGEKNRTIVNIVKAPAWERTGEVSLRVGGIDRSLSQLTDLLFLAAERQRPEAGAASEAAVLIRCDRDVRWREVQWVLQACARDPTRIFRIQFATAEE